MAYTYIQDAIYNWLEEDENAELEAAVSNLVDTAELQVIKDLDFTVFDVIATGAASGALITKPTGCISLLSFYVTAVDEDDNETEELLLPRTWEWVKTYGGIGTPIYYAEETETQWRIAPVPADPADYTLRFVKRPTLLSETDGATPTWVSANAPDALFWAAILQALQFLKTDTRRQLATDNYKTAVDLLKAENAPLIRRRYP